MRNRILDVLLGAIIGILATTLTFGPPISLAQGSDTTGRWYNAADLVPDVALLPTLASGCPTGYSEVADMSGVMPYGTVAANMDVNTTGGSNSVTPTVASLSAAAQVVSWPAGVPTHSGTTINAFTPTINAAGAIAWPAGVPTLSGTTINSFSSVINHTHTLTITSTSRVQGGTTASNTGTHIMTSTATGGSARAPTSGDLFTGTSDNPSGGVASITPTINNQGTIAWPAGVPTLSGTTINQVSPTINSQGTIAWPAGVPTNASSAVTGTLNSFDNRSAYRKVIWCTKS